VVIFDSLEREDIHKIIDIELSYLYTRIRNMGFNISVTPKAKDYIVEKGWDAQFGARPLKRAIQKYIEDPLAEEIIKTKLISSDIINVDLSPDTNEIIITIVKEDVKTV
jgi:ATP-dependent Clp protease ATP-binding subunit ClpC